MPRETALAGMQRFSRDPYAVSYTHLGGQNGGAQTGPNGQQYYDADYKVVDDDDNNKK